MKGTLLYETFSVTESLPNRQVFLSSTGINNDDVWLYQVGSNNVLTAWTRLDSVSGVTVSYNTVSSVNKQIYSVESRADDAITLVFGDGVFSTIPVGTFRCYVRSSNGLQYIINPAEMQSVVIPISYVSRTGQIETITFTCGITQPVSNSQARETIQEIKQRAPARYYTQNRMVNGEDYNLFPFTAYNSIIKSKAVNRASIGTSRYLELVDNTGKYASTNTFGSDGALYENYSLPSFQFSYTTTNEIADAITNQAQPRLVASQAQQFYYAKYPRPDLLVNLVSWHFSTTVTNATSGYFQTISDSTPVMIGNYASNNLKYVKVGALVKFVPPAGYFFDADNKLQVGVPTRPDEKLVIWASPIQVVGDGTNNGITFPVTF